MNTSFALSAYQWQGVWGERTTSTPGRGYCANLGHPEDETGLVYMRARYYEPGTGRFISEDPARDGVNWYLYADGDPVNRVDRDGKVDFPEWMEVSFAVATILAALLLSDFFRGVFIAAMSCLIVPLAASVGLIGVATSGFGKNPNELALALFPLYRAFLGIAEGYSMAQKAAATAGKVTLVGEILGFWSGWGATLWLTMWLLEKTDQ